MTPLVPRVLHRDSRRGYLAQIALDPHTLWAVGGTSSEITVLASSNAEDWHPRARPDTGIRGVLLRESDVVLVGEFGLVATTDDDGVNFETLHADRGGCLFSICEAFGSAWIAGDGGRLLRLDADGITKAESGTTSRINALIAVEGGLWLLGYDGVLRSHDGTASVPVFEGRAPLTDLTRTPHGTLVLTGDRGQIHRSTDGGRTFESVEHGQAEDLEAVGCTAEGHVVVVGGGGLVLLSTDDGASFTLMKLDLSGHPNLWCVTPFGQGVLIGGDEGLIVSLAPEGDTPWEGREDRFEQHHPLDAVLGEGPDGFLEERLRAFVLAVNPDLGSASGETPEPEEADDDSEADDDFEEEDNSEEDDSDEEELQGADAWKTAAWEKARHLWTGSTADFGSVWGIEPPAGLVAFEAATAGANPWSTFEELRLDCRLMADPPESLNLFELCVLSDQLNYLGTALPEAFAGLVCYGSLGNGDSVHLEVHDHGAGHVVQFWNHETHDYEFAFADSLEAAVYLAALCKAVDEEIVSDSVAETGLERLYERVAPSWHFSMDDRDPDFEEYEHPDDAQFTQFFFYRSAWIIGLLRDDGVTGIADLPGRFHANLNPVLPAEEIEPRREAVSEYVKTALYAMWRAYLFDEPELEVYLELGRSHRGRLARDCATLIDSLRAGRTQLGRIDDWPRHLERFRALDLDPRRAAEREAEAAAAAAEAQARAVRIVAALENLDGADTEAFLWENVREGAARPALLAHVLADPSRDAARRGLTFLMDQGYSRGNSLFRNEEHEATAWVARHCDVALQAVVAGQALYSVSLEEGVRLPGSGHCWAILLDLAQQGRLDDRVLPHLREALAAETLEDDPSWLMARYLGLVGAARDQGCVPALVALLERVPHEGGFETSLKYDDFVGEVADALREIGDPGAAPALVRFAGTPALRMRDARVGAAWALGVLAPELGTPAICETLVSMTTQINSSEENSTTLLAVALFARALDPDARPGLRQLVAESEPMSKSYVEVQLARALALRELGDETAEVDGLLAQCLTQPGWKHEYTVRRCHFALDVVDAGVPVDPALLVPLLGHGDARLSARVLDRVDAEPPRALTWFDTETLSTEALVAALTDASVQGRSHVARQLGERGEGRAALEGACREVMAAAPDNPANDLLSAPSRLLREAVAALMELPEADSTLAVYDALLRHPNRDVKAPVLRHEPDLPGLADAMRFVAAEKWAWQESAARDWLDAR